jgi:hypothetical protein
MRTTKKRGSMRKATRKGRKGSRKAMCGGNLGNIVTFGAPLTPEAPIGNTSTVVPQSSCLAENRFGMVDFPTTRLGLPGMSGGRRQRGGRYSFDLSQPEPVAAAPWAGGIPPVMRIPCESAVANPLNPVQMGGVGGIDSAFYAAPTAGYTNVPSSWVGTTGAPSLLQTPYDARTMNPACLKTGGGKRRRKGSRKGKRNSR